MNYIAATATFGLVFVLAYWLATKLLERRVSVMERIGGGGLVVKLDDEGENLPRRPELLAFSLGYKRVP